jgi:hypothetical protein
MVIGPSLEPNEESEPQQWVCSFFDYALNLPNTPARKTLQRG